jgi:hypothetical protein
VSSVALYVVETTFVCGFDCFCAHQISMGYAAARAACVPFAERLDSTAAAWYRLKILKGERRIRVLPCLLKFSSNFPHLFLVLRFQVLQESEK